VTCQPIVGLRNRALLGSRPVNKIPRRRDDVTLQEYRNVTCVYVVARRRAAILSDCNGSGRRDVTVLLNDAMTVARISLTQLGYISEAVSRFSSVFKEQSYESVLERSC
jgi:hypothetical protein